MIQHRFSFPRVARGKSRGQSQQPSHWQVTLADGDSLRILARIEFHHDALEWRLESCGDELPPSLRATWSHPTYKSVKSTVPAWLRDEIVAQLLVWAHAALHGRSERMYHIDPLARPREEDKLNNHQMGSLDYRFPPARERVEEVDPPSPGRNTGAHSLSHAREENREEPA